MGNHCETLCFLWLQFQELQLFVEAKNTGVRRTVHAGEDGPAENVRRAVDELHAERIGHGYHVMDDPLLYK